MRKSNIFVLFALLALSSCVSNPADDTFTAEELAPQSSVNAAAQAGSAAELASIDAQLASVDAQISGAQARLNSYQVQTPAVNQSMISGTEAEITHYQMLKNNLMVRKQELNAESAIK